MYGLYGLKHHIVEISGDVTDAGRTNEQGKIMLLSLWMLEGRVSQYKASFSVSPDPWGAYKYTSYIIQPTLHCVHCVLLIPSIMKHTYDAHTDVYISAVQCATKSKYITFSLYFLIHL